MLQCYEMLNILCIKKIAYLLNVDDCSGLVHALHFDYLCFLQPLQIHLTEQQLMIVSPGTEVIHDRHRWHL